jgi:hypothetical protein
MSTIKVDNLQTTAGAGLYPAKAWVNFVGTGTVAIRASGNVSSITDNGTGTYTVNFTSSMTDANYSSSGMAGYNASNMIGISQNRNAYAPTSAACRYDTTYQNNAAYDAIDVNVAINR